MESTQITFRLDRPVEELVPQMIGFNNTELLNKAKEIANYYSNIVYSDEQIKVAKDDKAKINNLIKSINSARIDVKNVYETPYAEFKQKIDEVVTCLQGASDTINKQVSEYESLRIQEKQTEIENYFDGVIGGLKQFISLDKIFNQKWLNASCSMKSVKADIDAKIEQIIKDIEALNALKSEDEISLKAYYFRSLDLGSVFVENERLKAEKERIRAAAERHENEQVKPQVQAQEPLQEQPAPITNTRTYDVTLEFTGLTYKQATSLITFVTSNNLPYKRIK